MSEMCLNSLAMCWCTKIISVFAFCPSHWRPQHLVQFFRRIHLYLNILRVWCRHYLIFHGGDDLCTCMWWWGGSGSLTWITSFLSATTTKFIFSNPLKHRVFWLLRATNFRRQIVIIFCYLCMPLGLQPVPKWLIDMSGSQRQTLRWKF